MNETLVEKIFCGGGVFLQHFEIIIGCILTSMLPQRNLFQSHFNLSVGSLSFLRILKITEFFMNFTSHYGAQVDTAPYLGILVLPLLFVIDLRKEKTCLVFFHILFLYHLFYFCIQGILLFYLYGSSQNRIFRINCFFSLNILCYIFIYAHKFILFYFIGANFKTLSKL